MGSFGQEHINDEPLSDAEEASYQLTIDSFQENLAYSCVRRIASYPTKPTITALQMSREPSIASRKRKTRSLRHMSSFSSMGTSGSYKNSAESVVSLSTSSSSAGTDNYEKNVTIQSLERLDVGLANPEHIVRTSSSVGSGSSVQSSPVVSYAAVPSRIPSGAVCKPAQTVQMVQHPVQSSHIQPVHVPVHQAHLIPVQPVKVQPTTIPFPPPVTSSFNESYLDEIPYHSYGRPNHHENFYRRSLVETRRSAVEQEMKRHSLAETRWAALETHQTTIEKKRALAQQGRRNSMIEPQYPVRPIPQYANRVMSCNALADVNYGAEPLMYNPPRRPQRSLNDHFIPQELYFNPIVSPYSQAVPQAMPQRPRPCSLQPPKQMNAPHKRFSNPPMNFKNTIRTVPESVLLAELGIRERPSLAYRISRHEAGIPTGIPDVFDFELPGFDPRTGLVRAGRRLEPSALAA